MLCDYVHGSFQWRNNLTRIIATTEICNKRDGAGDGAGDGALQNITADLPRMRYGGCHPSHHIIISLIVMEFNTCLLIGYFPSNSWPDTRVLFRNMQTWSLYGVQWQHAQ